MSTLYVTCCDVYLREIIFIQFNSTFYSEHFFSQHLLNRRVLWYAILNARFGVIYFIKWKHSIATQCGPCRPLKQLLLSHHVVPRTHLPWLSITNENILCKEMSKYICLAINACIKCFWIRRKTLLIVYSLVRWNSAKHCINKLNCENLKEFGRLFYEMEASSVTALSDVTPTGSQTRVITPDEIPDQVIICLDCSNKHTV